MRVPAAPSVPDASVPSVPSSSPLRALASVSREVLAGVPLVWSVVTVRNRVVVVAAVRVPDVAVPSSLSLPLSLPLSSSSPSVRVDAGVVLPVAVDLVVAVVPVAPLERVVPVVPVAPELADDADDRELPVALVLPVALDATAVPLVRVVPVAWLPDATDDAPGPSEAAGNQSEALEAFLRPPPLPAFGTAFTGTSIVLSVSSVVEEDAGAGARRGAARDDGPPDTLEPLEVDTASGGGLLDCMPCCM